MDEQRQENSCYFSEHSKFCSVECSESSGADVADFAFCGVAVDSTLLEQVLNATLQGDEVLSSVLYIADSDALSPDDCWSG